MQYDYFDYETVNGIHGDVIAPLPGITPKEVTSMNTSTTLPPPPAYVPSYTPPKSSTKNNIDWAKVFEQAKNGVKTAIDLVKQYYPPKNTYNGSGVNPPKYNAPPPPPKKDNTLMYGGLALAALYLISQKDKK